MFKWIKDLRFRWHKHNMTELGTEILDLMQNHAGWERSEHRLYHKESGVHLWISNGRAFLRLHALDKLPYMDSDYRNALNLHDKVVLWAYYKQMERNSETTPVEAALNMIRMYKMKGESND